ncbi:MAG: AAA family ATPase [Planctomycetes bacterium]|nr:AAA family ATPase [Planctomycetota bacterium]
MGNTLVEQQRKLLSDLAVRVKERAAGEVDIDKEHEARDEQVMEQYRAKRDNLNAEFEEEITKLRTEYQKKREKTIFNYESTSYAVVQEGEKFEKEAKEDYEDELDRAKRRYQAARRDAEDTFNQVKDQPKKELDRYKRRCEKRRDELRELRKQAEKILRRRGCDIPDELPKAADATEGDPLEHYQVAYTAAHRQLRILTRQPAAMFLEAGWPFLIALFTAIGLGLTSLVVDWFHPVGEIVAAVAIAVATGLIVRRIVRPYSRRQTQSVVPSFMGPIADGETAIQAALRHAEEEAKRKYEEHVERRETAISEAHAMWSNARIDLAKRHEMRLQKAAEERAIRRQKLQDDYNQTLKSLDQKHPPLINERERRFTDESQQLIDERQRELEESKRESDKRWEDLVSRWSSGMSGFEGSVEEMNSLCDRRSPEWHDMDPTTWTPPEEELPALRFGTLGFRLDMIDDGVPEHERLQVTQTEFSLPSALSYPECPSLLYVADGEGREQAVRSLQNVMLRLLTSLPPGKVRYTIIDPIGLGQNFSAFMHLADYDEKLVASRIWTEAIHINKRLADLTEHMENVIQKYLRNEFDSIQEYNKHAGEVAEPFQILVVANFPANFAEEAARRLVSIASSGARCGVYTLVTIDTKLKMPRNFDVADLATNAVTLRWDGERFCFRDDDLEQLPLALDMPPDDERFTQIVRAVGERAKDASRVEVPFTAVVPQANEWWDCDSRAELEVPLGRAGATNLRTLRLGKGTSQHVLISGKTGSGKSTLLHTIITTVSIYYSPNEVHFYLIDFKKGVEFKAYASFQLPHARVIAIESEREFGMSVLNRLDVELRRRGDEFRKQGVQDLKGYRDANPEAVMPRILLIIDEFQEFFVKDDKISQDASLVLDRLVRQGRAFGIHVLLGSQTLAGAYSLARATLGQMAVRIALQCSEADAHLILSDDNTAARLLGRPGEAIYNDANGLFEGNHPFQVVWLPDYEREQYLERIAEMARQQQCRLTPPIVFEGNVPADPAKNEVLCTCLEDAAPTTHKLAPRAWLGAAVAIKEPAAAVFHRQGGTNVLMVGQQEQEALGVFANCVVSLAAEAVPGRTTSTSDQPSFYVFDGQRPESPTAGFWTRLSKQLPLEMKVATPGDIAAAISDIAGEVDRRLQASDSSAPPIFLVLFNLARFRDLRKSDDYNLSFDEQQAAGLDQQLSTILREGPNFGVHSLIWCDTFANVNRWIDRQSMSDLAIRVLFQMGATDSANLMDSPEASRLGIHRAILYSEEQGEFEKFRPYGPPSPDWLTYVREQLEKRQGMQSSQPEA